MTTDEHVEISQSVGRELASVFSLLRDVGAKLFDVAGSEVTEGYTSRWLGNASLLDTIVVQFAEEDVSIRLSRRLDVIVGDPLDFLHVASMLRRALLNLAGE